MATQKKKNTTGNFNLAPESTPPIMTSGTKTVQGRTPTPKPKRIDLTNDQGFANYAQNVSNVRAPILERQMNTPKPIRQRTGKDAGTIIGWVNPDGTSFKGGEGDYLNMLDNWNALNPGVDSEQAKIQKEIDTAKQKKEMIAAQTPPNVTPEQLANLDILTPEQIAIAQGDATLPGGANLKTVLASAGERASLGASGGALAGAGVGSLAGGVGAIPGAAAGAIVGGVGGAVSGLWASYKDVSADNVKGVDNNVQTAKEALNKALQLANRGGSYEEVKKTTGDAIANLLLAERQYKEQQKSIFAGQTDPDVKLNDLRQYMKEILPGQISRIEIALQKPDPVYLNNPDEQGGFNNG